MSENHTKVLCQDHYFWMCVDNNICIFIFFSHPRAGGNNWEVGSIALKWRCKRCLSFVSCFHNKQKSICNKTTQYVPYTYYLLLCDVYSICTFQITINHFTFDRFILRCFVFLFCLCIFLGENTLRLMHLNCQTTKKNNFTAGKT